MKEKLKTIDFRFFIGCSCYIGNINDVSTIEGINIPLNSVIVKGKNGTEYYNPSLIKPVLRRFESLSRHEVYGLNELWPNESIARTTFGSIQLDANIIDYLTSLNVDVFGWIDQELAIDAASQ